MMIMIEGPCSSQTQEEMILQILQPCLFTSEAGRKNWCPSLANRVEVCWSYGMVRPHVWKHTASPIAMISLCLPHVRQWKELRAWDSSAWSLCRRATLSQIVKVLQVLAKWLCATCQRKVLVLLVKRSTRKYPTTPHASLCQSVSSL